MTASYQCTITGKVQGVFFRAWIHDQAVSLGVKGWVRNVADGRVEVLAQGADDAIEELKKRLRTGSPMTTIKSMECKPIDYDKEYDSFEIRS